MAQAADAMKARDNLNGTVIDGRKIEVIQAWFDKIRFIRRLDLNLRLRFLK